MTRLANRWNGENLSVHCLRVALDQLVEAASDEGEPDHERINLAWAVMEVSRPWATPAWRRALRFARRMIEANAEAGAAASIVAVALARECRWDPSRERELQDVVDAGLAASAPWATALDKPLAFRRFLRGD